jgi:TonB family protein
MLLRFLVCSFLLVTATAAEAGSEPRAPTGQWTVSFADAQCVASRPYGTEEEPVYFTLKAPALGEVMQISLIRKGRQGPIEQTAVTIQADEQTPLKTNMLTFPRKGTGLRVHLLNMASADFSRVRAAKNLKINSLGLSETLSLSQIEPLLKIMEKCVTDLRQVWNVSDPSGEQSALHERAKANLASLFSDEDYPAMAIRKNQSGAARFVVLVDEAGRVADCTIIETSGIAVLDTQTCAIVKVRGKFVPARGPDGKPAKDAAIASIKWVATKD